MMNSRKNFPSTTVPNSNDLKKCEYLDKTLLPVRSSTVQYRPGSPDSKLSVILKKEND